jgi:hypothetical protein
MLAHAAGKSAVRMVGEKETVELDMVLWLKKMVVTLHLM